MISNIWTGTKVRLRSVLSSDWEKYHNNDYDSECERLCDVIHFPRSEEGTKLWAEHQSSKTPDGDNYMFAIETLDGELVGGINAHSCDSRNGTFKYGIGIFREHWRKGYASEAVKLLLRYYFEELRYHKVTANIYAFNDSSIAIHESLGFKQEGRLRKMIFTNGKHFDELIYGLLNSEYEELNR
ncbi:SPBc2 prophage-derived uncharacterized N-acetyltransferase YokL [Paenibacillus baekrokdamisoli]|uniref:SPBc2 prophage-derived uncharacterized N-acetyltransferase YokL n=1 Tax=Paenibacillus baekrokdamisoli TaxID=1712516 RepID=A0A3G9JPF8_9BACL|nr:GNAT family N-acetyltransferase [Paenibacillus baekrokdamisoli]MBB3072149.1 RimJ/RimL family protein N-acetyltransferase [Paenibacillus baekrokdamisoli]BBH24734.1 SPBc2 prophage-derived uncharacterized N-acetyltransferase YokL [Paenibacillus baekrokdamisoli]